MLCAWLLQEELEHDDHCAVCKEEGNLQQCHSCTRAYHLDCLHPPLKSPPKGMWMCPKCQKKVSHSEHSTHEYGLLWQRVMFKSNAHEFEGFLCLSLLKVLNKENLSWPHNFVQSYVTHKTGTILYICINALHTVHAVCVCS